MEQQEAVGKVAIVDDEPSLRMVFSLALKTAGYSTVNFGGGLEFLRSGNLEEISIIIVDLRMPGIDGLTMLTQLHEMGRNIPAILCSANVTKDIEDQAKLLGVHQILHKPVSAHDLRNAVSSTLTSQSV